MDGSDGKSLEGLAIEESGSTHVRNPVDLGTQLDNQFQSTSALEILRETVRILRYNSTGFMAIAALLICPVSAVQLFDLFADSSMARRLATRLLLIARTSGLPLTPLVKQSSQRFSEMAVSIAVCFPLYATLLLLSKAAVVYSVDCTYSKMQFDASKFCVVFKKLWRRIMVTYIWACMVIVGVITLSLAFLVAACNVFLLIGFAMDFLVYPSIVVGVVFSVVFAKAIIVSNVAVVVSVLEDASGLQALGRANFLVRGQIQVGLLMYVGSTLGMAFVQGLFDHRVKTLSYGDGSSRIWEGPLLVVMYSFIELIDSMMTAVFYFSCRAFSMEATNEEAQPILEMTAATPSTTSV